MFLSLLLETILEISGKVRIVGVLSVIAIIWFLILNYQKYVFVSYDTSSLNFPVIILAIYLLSPFFITCYDIGNVYQLGMQ